MSLFKQKNYPEHNEENYQWQGVPVFYVSSQLIQ